MQIEQVRLGFIYGLNKLGTNSSQNIHLPQFVYLINKAQLHWFEARVKAKEQNQVRTDELNSHLVEITPKIAFKQGYFYEFPLPADYFHWQRFHAEVSGCNSKVWGKFVEEANIGELMKDDFTVPSAAWEEVLVTRFADKMRVYVDDFQLSKGVFSYFRTPRPVDIAGYTKNDGPSSNIDLEFDHVHAEEIIDLAAQIAAGKIQDIGRLQTITRHIQEHN